MSEWHTRQNSSTLDCSRVNISRPLPLWPLAMAPALETFTSRSSRRYGGNIKTVAIVRDSFPPGLRLPSFQVLILDSDGQNLPFPPSSVKPHQSASSNTDWNSANSACLQSMRILQWHCWLHTDPLSEGETRTVQCPGYNGVQRLSRGQTTACSGAAVVCHVCGRSLPPAVKMERKLHRDGFSLSLSLMRQTVLQADEEQDVR